MKPWTIEPSHATFYAEGLWCEIKRHPSLLHLCGYVGVPEQHPLHGAAYDDDVLDEIEVHGGITYQNTRDGLFVFGFDCAHAGDLSPARDSILHDDDDVYRDFAYVESEVRSLAKQLSDFRHPLAAEIDVESTP